MKLAAHGHMLSVFVGAFWLYRFQICVHACCARDKSKGFVHGELKGVGHCSGSA